MSNEIAMWIAINYQVPLFFSLFTVLFGAWAIKKWIFD